ncbi:pyridoxamine 5'-phosphate oxidase family protein [Fibrobacter sp.]|uniref:pyridoxamine 5'-phosphate oxidase family protein n=1 Tax=Fibrobacter sp. TaxID=35828 RepID=UPI0025B96556|nr:pyridoxamine 5'-phosphate oxidase family protein [Fibrobacter sp.]MBR4007165.1 pyridoxamine 5'-phosphate oxidase family protein [Fibrobacter sp.]
MRRKDREVTGDENIAKIIEQCTTCHIAMVDDADAGMPYVIPMSFGYSLKDGVLELYFHCAHVGKKLDCIRKNPNVAFSMCVENRIEIHEDVYCKSGRFYASVVGQGKAEIVEDSAEKCLGLSLLMERQAAGSTQQMHAAGAAHGSSSAQLMHAAPHKYEFTPAQAAAVTVLKITSTNFTGKAKNDYAQKC